MAIASGSPVIHSRLERDERSDGTRLRAHKEATMTARNFTYHYHANALGLGGVLKNDRGVIPVPSLASVALADSGGEGSDHTTYDQDGISVSDARCHLPG